MHFDKRLLHYDDIYDDTYDEDIYEIHIFKGLVW